MASCDVTSNTVATESRSAGAYQSKECVQMPIGTIDTTLFTIEQTWIAAQNSDFNRLDIM
jgi:hypothetical protein